MSKASELAATIFARLQAITTTNGYETNIGARGFELSPAAVGKVKAILQSTEVMSKLMENLLAFSRLSYQPLNKRPVDMMRLAREAIRLFAEEQSRYGVQFELDALPPCWADRTLLKQVLINLLSNAIKFSRKRETPRIKVGFREKDGEIVYFVRDNGVGFDMVNVDAIFRSFQRLKNASNIEGSGVGLALVRRIVRYHGGKIWAEGTDGIGATFYFTLGKSDSGEELDEEKVGIVHASVGKKSMGSAKLKENFMALLGAVLRAKPSTSKGVYIKTLSLSSTMGPGI